MTTTNFPKIDLHLHIDGSLSLPCFQTLASNVGLSMTDAQIRKAVMVSNTCQSLPEYLQCFELPTRLLQTEKAAHSFPHWISSVILKHRACSTPSCALPRSTIPGRD